MKHAVKHRHDCSDRHYFDRPGENYVVIIVKQVIEDKYKKAPRNRVIQTREIRSEPANWILEDDQAANRADRQQRRQRCLNRFHHDSSKIVNRVKSRSHFYRTPRMHIPLP